MLTKLSVWLSAVPHYVLVLALAVTLWGPRVVTMLTGTELGAWAQYVREAIVFANGILMLAKQFSPGTKESAISDIGIAKKSIPPIALGCLCLALAGCTPTAQQTALNTIPADLTTGLCIVSGIEADVKAGMAWPAVIADLITKCGSDVATILNVADGYYAGQVTSGKTTPDAAQAQHRALRDAARAHKP